MASCDVKNKPYGYWCGDLGTTATVITTDLVKVLGILFVTTGSAHSVQVLQSDGTPVVTYTSAPGSLIKLFELGERYNGLAVRIATDTADRILIFTK